jgi:hypothetical protein
MALFWHCPVPQNTPSLLTNTPSPTIIPSPSWQYLQPFGISPSDNVVKECGEEASVPPELAARAVATGARRAVTMTMRERGRPPCFTPVWCHGGACNVACEQQRREYKPLLPAHLAPLSLPKKGFISYASLLPEGLKPDVLYCYDLQLPASFRPAPQDGEVEEFMLWDLAEVARVIAHTDDYKPNCGVVVMDFLVCALGRGGGVFRTTSWHLDNIARSSLVHP